LEEFQNALIFGDLSNSVWIARTDDETGVRNRDWVFGKIAIDGEVQPAAIISLFANVDGEPILNSLDFETFSTTLYFLHLDE